MTNDDNNIASGTTGSPAGTVITNYPAIFSDQNLLAIANEVSTTILPDPGIIMSKHSTPENVVAADQEFDWIIDYKSNSGNPTVNYVLRDTLPTGIIYLGATNTWNSTPASLGALAGTTTTLNPIITNNPDGTTGVEVQVTGPLRGGNILKDEGGHITFRVKSVPTATSNTRYANKAIATYDNGNGNLEYEVSDDITIQNTDVTINKLVDNATPIVGDTVGYTVKVSNRTELDAAGVKIVDTLPAGICYVAGSTRVITTGWTLSEPSVSPQVCNNSQPTTLTWNNVIDGPSTAIGVLPGMAHNSLAYTEVIISYSGKVNVLAASGSTLTNNAVISTTTPEDNVFPNTSNVSVVIPKVDLTASKTGVETLLPGDDIDYSIGYSNYSKQFANNVYLIDTLPNSPRMKLISVSPTHGELICYSNAATKPAFVSGGGCGQAGWSTTLLANSTYVAIDYSKGTTALAGATGPFTVTFSMRAVDPTTNVNLSVGTSYVNTVEVNTSSVEDTLVNNVASVTSRIPAADMSIKKTGSSEGPYPGLAPGDTIKYTFEVANLGTVDACNVSVTDAFPSNLSLTTPNMDYTSLSLVDYASSSALKAHDLLGNDVVDDIEITLDTATMKYTLGGAGICFPPQSKAYLTLNAKINSSTADNTVVTNAATVSIPAHEDVTTNNTDDSNVTVYKADVLTSKDGISCGKDNICGNTDDSQVEVNPGESIRYKIKYDNLGGIDAKNTIITENIPEGSCFVLNSINPPSGAKVEYSINGAVTWTYSPPTTSGTDCSITNFRVVWASLPSPANSSIEDITADFVGSVTPASSIDIAGDELKLLSSPLPSFNTAHNATETKEIDDINSDGKPELLITNLGYDEQICVSQPDYPYYYCNVISTGGNTTSSTLVGDINSDGKKDFVLGNDFGENEKVCISTEFTPYFNCTDITSTGGNTKKVIAMGDLNADAKIDFVIINNGSNNKSCVSQAASPYYTCANIVSAITSTVNAVVLADKNADGKNDLMMINASNNDEQVCTSQVASPYFSCVSIVGTAGISVDAKPIGDINADTVDDYVIANRSGASNVCSSQVASPYFTCIAIPLTSIETTSITTLTNLAGSATPDFVLTNDLGGDEIACISNTASPFFDCSAITGTAGNTRASISAGDLNSDGTEDMLLANFGGNEKVCIGQSSPPYFNCIDLATSGNTIGITKLTDVNNDFKSDYMFVNSDTNNILCQSTSASPYFSCGPVLNESSLLDKGNTMSSTSIGDINADGKDDIMVGNYGENNQVCTSNPSAPYFSCVSVPNTSGFATSPVTVPDVNADGKSDVFVANDLGGNEQLCLSTAASPFFICSDLTGTAGNTTKAVLGSDYNGDGKPEVIVSNNAGLDEKICISQAIAPYYSCSAITSTSGNSQSIGMIADSNADGKLDFIVSNSASSSLACMSNSTSPFFSCATITTSNTNVKSITELGDVNGDSKTDFIQNNDSGIDESICLSTSVTPFFTCSAITGTAGTTKSSTLINDMNADGRKDLILANYGENKKLCQSISLAPFFSCTDIPSTATKTNEVIATPDLNGDGQNELIFVNDSSQDDTRCMSKSSSPFFTCSTIDGSGGSGKSYVEIPNPLDTSLKAYIINNYGEDEKLCTTATSSPYITCHTGVNAYASTGYYITKLSSLPGITLWDKFLSAKSIGDGSSLTYTLCKTAFSATATCSAANTIYSGTLDSGYTDISSVPTSVVDIYVKVEMKSNVSNSTTPVIDRMLASWRGPSPSFDFDVKVMDNDVTNVPINVSTINNVVNIATTTPETRTDNNNGADSLNLVLTDLKIEKVVDKASAVPGDDINYTIKYSNLGPNKALESKIVDNFPTELDFVSAVSSTAGVTCNFAADIITCTKANWTIDINEVGTITVVAKVKVAEPNGTAIANVVNISSYTHDSDLTNNDAMALTIVGINPNVYLLKDGPVGVHLGEEYSYYITYGNNGNDVAQNVQVVDHLPSNVTYVSSGIDVFYAITPPQNQNVGFTCAHDGINPGGTVTCTGDAALPIGDRGVIKITVKLANDYALLTTPTNISNDATISTTSTETNANDNSDNHTFPVTIGALSSIMGKVFVDRNADVTMNSYTNMVGTNLDDKAKQDLNVFIFGKDIQGNVMIPSPTLYPTEFQAAIAKLISSGLIPNATYSATSLPDNALIMPPSVTNSDGGYAFNGLWPGDYDVIQQTPVGYVATNSTSDRLTPFDPDSDNGVGSIQDPTVAKNNIFGIHLDEGEISKNNDFGLYLGEIGNQIFLDTGAGANYNNGTFDYTDTNGNGRYDSGDAPVSPTGDQPLAGVQVTLYKDVNRNGIVDAADIVVSQTGTDAYGLYLFTDLPLNDDTYTDVKYLVKVTERTDTTSTTPNVLATLSNTTLVGGTAENTNKLETGYAITLDGTNRTNYTADFGYLPKVEIGNQIWNDLDQDSTMDVVETALPNVLVELYYDANGNGVLDAGEQTPVSKKTTDANGFYLFTDITLDATGATLATPTPLRPGNYFVGIPKSNFALNAPLYGYYSSGTTIQVVGANTEDPSDLTNADNNDNGSLATTGFYTGGVMSNVIQMVAGIEPTIEKATLNQGTTPDGQTPGFTGVGIDKNSNLTIDFGFFRPVFASIGDFVWDDVDADGIQDASEIGVAGVTAKLYDSTNTLIATVITDSNGKYLFDKLVPASYHIEFSTLPAGYVVSDTRVGTDINVDSDGLITPVTNLIASEADMSWDLGIHKLASIGDTVWNDLNRDGIQDATEVGVPNVTVKLYNSANALVGIRQTDANGKYLFADLMPGDYHVEFSNLPADYLVTSKDTGTDDTKDSDGLITISTHLDAGENDLSWDLGIYQTASIGDKVWYDLNNDGIQNLGEGGVPNVTVKLYKSNGTLVSTQTTDASGNYKFSALDPADYYVEFSNLPANYFATPADKGLDDSKDSDAVLDATNVLKTPVTTLTPGEYDPSWDLGIYQPASLGNFVWNDTNQNGIQDSGEVGVANVTVNLYDSLGTLVKTTTTDASGKYLFDKLFPGDYYVTFTDIPASYTATAKDKLADDTVDSDASLVNNVLQTGIVNLSQGENDMTVDLGIFQSSAIGNKVFNDVNHDGIQDSGDLPVQFVTVKLYNNLGVLVSTQVTDVNGNYHFTGLIPGDYHVEFSNLPAGYLVTATHTGSDINVDSDGLVTSVTTLSPSEDDLSWDLGIYLPASLGDRVWSDINHDGLQDPSEIGVQNVTVKIYDATNTLVGTTTTDINGNYLFDNLKSGDYHVEFSNLPAGFVASPSNVGSDDARDSDGLVAATTHLDPGENDMNWDLGIYQPAQVGNRVWLDTNGDGIQSAGEVGVQNVTVKLYDEFGNLVATQTTDATGAYMFTGVVPGQYRVDFTNIPVGYVISPTNTGTNIAIDSDGLSTPFTTLDSGENDMTWDLGLYLKASLGNYVWNDANADGIQNANEEPVSGVTVQLYDSANVLIGTTTTDTAGAYQFVNLDPGTYHVEFSNLPATYKVSPPNAGTDDAADSDGIYNSTTSKAVSQNVTLVGGEQNTTLDLGIYIPSSIGNFVWFDLDEDGIQDAGELGVPNVTVKLYNENNVLLATKTTDANGAYLFDDLGAAIYHVEFSNLPADFVPSPTDAGGNDTKDSDGIVTLPIALGTGEQNLTLDLGIFEAIVKPPASIGDKVFNDYDSDGVQDAGELGVSGITVKLYRKNIYGVDELAAISTTDANGNYLFTNLKPGEYHLEFSDLPAGFIVSPADQGGDDTKDSDGTGPVTKIITPQTVLDPGENDMSWDLGIYKPASIGNLVWLDANGNGKQDVGEAGIPSITVTLYDDLGNVLATQNTDANGNYLFTNLEPGTYKVAFSNVPANYQLSPTNVGTDRAIDSNGLITSNIVLNSGDANLTIDLGIFAGASLGNFVWNDVDKNGKQDASEPGVEGVTVTLYNLANQVIGTTTTDANGAYAFDSLLPGDYYVVFSDLPDGYFPTAANAGTSDALDSDADYDASHVLKTGIINLSNGENDVDTDLGLVSESGIGNLVWADVNANGIQDDGELGVPNVTVKLFNSANVLVGTKTTDADGKYEFLNLAPGDCHVEFSNLPTNFVATKTKQGNNDRVDSNGLIDAVTTLSPGELDLTHDLGIFQGAKLGRFIWDDTNQDGLQDPGELPLAGVKVNLYDENGTLIDTVVSDANGLYEFVGLKPGSYHTETPYTLPYVVHTDTSPSTDLTIRSGNIFKDANADGVNNNSELPQVGLVVNIYDDLGNLVATTTTDASGNYSFTGLDESKTYKVIVPDMDTGIQDKRDMTIVDNTKYGGDVWNDVDGDGAKDASELPLPNVIIELYDADGNLVDTQTTDANGKYLFVGLDPAVTYHTKVKNPIANSFPSPVGVGNDNTKDSDGLVTNEIILASGDSNYTLGLGMYFPAIVGNLVWIDANKNGIQDAGEVGVPNVTVNLYDNANNLVASMPTDTNGNYRFEKLVPGDYHVEFESLPANYVTTGMNVGTDSSVDSDGPVTVSFNLKSGQLDLSRDLGIYLNDTPIPANPASLGDTVWVDADKDGIFDASEQVVSGVIVNLLDKDGTVVATQVTNAKGKYKFNNLQPGDYFVEFKNLPSGYDATITGAGADKLVDSSGLKTPKIQLVAGTQDLSYDLGIVKTSVDKTPLELTGAPMVWWLVIGGMLVMIGGGIGWRMRRERKLRMC